MRFPVELGVAHARLDEQHLFVAVIRDLSAEKLLEAENVRVRRYLDLIMGNSPSVFYLLSQEMGQHAVFKWLSPNIKEILGIDAEDLILQNLSFDSLIHEDDLERVHAAQEEIWENGDGSQEYRVATAESGMLWIRDTQRVLDHDSGDVREIVGTLQDITEGRAGEERERTLRRELDHRVKNNLQIILGVCDKAAESEVLDKDSMVGLAARIRSMSLVHQLLADEGWRPIDLGEVIRQGVLGLAGESAWSKVRMHGNELCVGVDAAMTLGSVINELITNATKYGGLTPEGLGVDVSWRIEIIDEEAFMKLSWVEKVNDAIEASFDRRSFGIQLIESMIPYELDGEVDLEVIDGGVSFQAVIPLENCTIDIGRVRGQIRNEDIHSMSSLNRKFRIMVVEDAFLIGMDLKMSLEQMGYEVLGPVPTSARAMDILERDGCDGAILDVSLWEGRHPSRSPTHGSAQDSVLLPHRLQQEQHQRSLVAGQASLSQAHESRESRASGGVPPHL